MSGEQWTLGSDCWWCTDTWVPVLWLGHVKHLADTVPLYACASCTDRLIARIHDPHGTAPGCWWCPAQGVPTVELGRAAHRRSTAPIFACPGCAEKLSARAQDHTDARYRVA